MPTKIKPDYRPGPRVYELFANRYGIDSKAAQEFIGHELGEFQMYWEGRTDAGAAKSNWDSTCLNWMKVQYDNKKERMAQHRPYSPQQGNIFEQALNSVNTDKPTVKEALNSPRPLRLVSKPIPGEGETMSEESAFDQLKKMGIL